MSDLIRMFIKAESIHLTFGANCGHEQEDSVMLSEIADYNYWPICPECGADLELVNVIVDVPVFNRRKENQPMEVK